MALRPCLLLRFLAPESVREFLRLDLELFPGNKPLRLRSREEGGLLGGTGCWGSIPKRSKSLSSTEFMLAAEAGRRSRGRLDDFPLENVALDDLGLPRTRLLALMILAL